MAAKNKKYIPKRFRLPIIDSDREVVLRVTDLMCKTGERDNPGNCALAKAAKAAFRGLQNVQVLKDIAYFEFRTHVERFRVPKKTGAMIRHFDKGLGFKPGDYIFGPVPPSIRLGSDRNKNYTPRGTTNPRKGRRAGFKHIPPRGNGQIGWISPEPVTTA